MKTPRPYQVAAHDATLDQLKTYDSTVVVLPTGLGKTVLASKLIVGWERGNCLFLAHTRELINQAADKLAVELGYRPAVEMNVHGVELDTLYQGGLVVVGSVQTMYGDRRLKKYERHPFGLIVVDECVTGDTLIETDAGKIRIDHIPAYQPSSVMTYDGVAVCYRPITAFMPKGVRPVLRIETASGRVIRCTGNHPLFTTRGWVNAEAVRESDSLLSVSAGAANRPASTIGGDPEVTHPATTGEPFDDVGATSGSESTTASRQRPRPVSAGAANGCDSGRGHSNRSSASTKGIGATAVSSRGTTDALPRGGTNSRRPSDKLYSEPCSATAASATQTSGATTHVCGATTAALNAIGSVTSRGSCPPSDPCSPKRPAVGTGQPPCHSRHPAFPAWVRSTTSPTAEASNASPANGSTGSGVSASRGGLVTTARHPETDSPCTQRATTKMTCGSPPSGSARGSDRPACTSGGDISCSLHSPRPAAESLNWSDRTCPNACSTSFDPVVSVRSDGAEPVYDITVEGTHCFFGNGVLVHNCHHATSATYTKVIDHFRKLNPSLKVVGITATPNRADGTALGLMFDSVAYQMSINDAITGGWLVPVRQEYVVVDSLDLDAMRLAKNEFGEKDFKAADLEAVLTEEEALHKQAIPIIDKVGERRTLVFTSTVKHAHDLAAVLNRYKDGSAAAVDGTTLTERRKELIRDFSDGKLQFLCNCAVLTEGFDAPVCSAIVMARPTKSLSLYTQMLGRGLRPLPGLVDGVSDAHDRRMSILESDKPACLVLDFVGNSEHKLASSYDVLGGNYDVEVRKLAQQEARRQVKDVNEVMEQAAALLVLEQQMRERKQYVAAGASYAAFDADPFADGPPIVGAADMGGAKRGGASDNQVGLLVNLGVARHEALAMTKRQAGAVIDSLKDTRCTAKQAKVLAKHGIPAAGIGMERASRIIDAIAQNGWKRPEELPE